jgi:hypothetical protein
MISLTFCAAAWPARPASKNALYVATLVRAKYTQPLFYALVAFLKNVGRKLKRPK